MSLFISDKPNPFNLSYYVDPIRERLINRTGSLNTWDLKWKFFSSEVNVQEIERNFKLKTSSYNRSYMAYPIRMYMLSNMRIWYEMRGHKVPNRYMVSMFIEWLRRQKKSNLIFVPNRDFTLDVSFLR